VERIPRVKLLRRNGNGYGMESQISNWGGMDLGGEIDLGANGSDSFIDRVALPISDIGSP
jgi:hypothetical protein